MLLEALTGRAADGGDPLEGLAAASLTTANGERKPLPKPLAELLRRALGREPGERFAGMADLRKAIDALVFSGDFAPTTFDLAFFMHTLFRDDMEREARALEEARRADYSEFLAEEKPAAPAGPPATSRARRRSGPPADPPRLDRPPSRARPRCRCRPWPRAPARPCPIGLLPPRASDRTPRACARPRPGPRASPRPARPPLG